MVPVAITPLCLPIQTQPRALHTWARMAPFHNNYSWAMKFELCHFFVHFREYFFLIFFKPLKLQPQFLALWGMQKNKQRPDLTGSLRPTLTNSWVTFSKHKDKLWEQQESKECVLWEREEQTVVICQGRDQKESTPTSHPLGWLLAR